jgi:hypothetical protein
MHLVLLVCLVLDPMVCRIETAPSAATTDAQCITEAALWGRFNPAWSVLRFSCRPPEGEA